MPLRLKNRTTRKKAAPQNPIQAVEKGLRLLNAFTLQTPEWGVRELGRELGINPSTTHRLIKTLQAAGYVDRDSAAPRYRLGPKVVELAYVYTHINPLPSVALKIFEAHSDRFKFNFYLCALRGYQLVYLARLEGRGPIKVSAEPGQRLALHSSAAGKVLLAFQEENFLADYLKHTRLKAYTERTIMNPEALRRELGQTRERDWAQNDGEHYEEIGAVSVPVRDRGGSVIASVSLAYPRYLLKEARLELPALLDLARTISCEITAHI